MQRPTAEAHLTTELEDMPVTACHQEGMCSDMTGDAIDYNTDGLPRTERTVQEDASAIHLSPLGQSVKLLAECPAARARRKK